MIEMRNEKGSKALIAENDPNRNELIEKFRAKGYELIDEEIPEETGESREELDAMSVEELEALCEERDVTVGDDWKKSDYVDALAE